MLSFGSITPGAGAGSKWEYNGGTPPSTIKTITGVTGIKNPLPANGNFYQIFDSNVLGVDFFEGCWLDETNDKIFNGTLKVLGDWLTIQTAQSGTTSEATQAVCLKDRTFRTGINAPGTEEFADELTFKNWRLIDINSGQTVFRVDRNGRISTNQANAPVSTNTHDFDLPIYDISGTLKGYIKIYRPS